MLSVWAFYAPHCGGFKQPEDRSAAASILKAFCSTLQGMGWQMLLFMDEHAQHQPPKLDQGRLPFILEVADDLGVGVARLRAFCLEHADHRLAQAWLNIPGLPLTEGRDSIPLLDFVSCISKAAFKSRAVHVLMAQVLRDVGARLDDVLGAASKGGPHLNNVQFKTFTGSSDTDRAYRLQGYMEAAALATERPGALQFLSCCTDKSRVSGMPMQNTALALPNNVAWWSPPQVLRDPESTAYFVTPGSREYENISLQFLKIRRGLYENTGPPSQPTVSHFGAYFVATYENTSGLV